MLLFAGALLSVTFGVALVQSSLLLLITAALLDPPAGLSAAERLQFTDGTTAAVSMLGVVLGGATFLAVFIISSTFAFTVDLRRRDFALLRLVGVSRGQVRRRVLREALALGALGAALGIPAGLALMRFQAWLMRRFGFVPAGFEGQWRGWILAVSFGTGIALAVAGVLVAARRAARVRPLEALRETGAAARTMTAGRWIAAVVFGGGTLALVIVAPHGGSGGGPALAMNVPFPAAIALVCLAPLLVPLIARVMPMGTGVLGGLARANLRDARRRSASVAGPLIVLAALVLGNAGAGASLTTASIADLQRLTKADLVVGTTGPVGGRIAAVPGVASVSTESEIPAEMITDPGTEDQETEVVSLLVIDTETYAPVHGSGDALAGLRGRQVAAGPGGEVPRTGTIRLRLPERDLGEVPVAGGVPSTLSGGANLLAPAGLVTAAELASAPTRSFVTLRPGADPAAVRAALTPVGTVTPLADWLRAVAEERNATNRKVGLVVLGLGALYALLGVVNSVVIGTAGRRREFAEARVTGMTRGQVIRSALLEAYAVTGAGLLLGGLAAAATFVAVLRTTAAVTGTGTLDLPWQLITAVAAVALVATGVTSLITTWSATRRPPVALLGARE